MRSRPGACVAACAKRLAGGWAQCGAPRSGPATASSRAAASRTLRVSANSMPRPLSGSLKSGPVGVRPRVGLSPTSPHHAAGTRIEPPPSLAWASGAMPALTAAAEPPLEPPGLRPRSHGLWLGP